MNPLLALARPEILALEPYRPCAPEPTLERMHANENPWRAPGDNSGLGLNRYPEPQPQSLVRRLAARYDVARTASSSAAGAMRRSTSWSARSAAQASIGPGIAATFGMYAVPPGIQGAAVDELTLSAPPASRRLRVRCAGAGARTPSSFSCALPITPPATHTTADNPADRARVERQGAPRRG